MDLDYAEAEDILIGSEPDNRHGVRSEPVGLFTTQLFHLTPFQNDDQIMDLNGEARGVNFGPAAASDGERSVHCEPASSVRPIIHSPISHTSRTIRLRTSTMQRPELLFSGRELTIMVDTLFTLGP